MALNIVSDTRNAPIYVSFKNDSWDFTTTSTVNAALGQTGVVIDYTASGNVLDFSGRLNVISPLDGPTALGIFNLALDTTINLNSTFNFSSSNGLGAITLIESHGNRTTVNNYNNYLRNTIDLNGTDSTFNNYADFQGELKIAAGGTVVNNNTGKLSQIIVSNPNNYALETKIISEGGWTPRISGAEERIALVGSNGIERIENRGYIYGNLYLYGGNDEVNDVGGGLRNTDIVYGGSGDDTFYYGWTWSAGFGNLRTDYTIVENGGEGYDHLLLHEQFLLNFTDVTLQIPVLPDNVEKMTLLGNADAEVWGNQINNVIIGNLAENKILGLGGNDTIAGGGSNDSVFGGDGADILRGDVGSDRLLGNNGRDTLSGGTDADRLFGGADADKLHGGKGNDLLHGGDGADRFIFRTGDGADHIVDFQNGFDKIDLTGWKVITSFSDLRNDHLSVAGDDLLIRAGNDRLKIEDTKRSQLDSSDFLF